MQIGNIPVCTIDMFAGNAHDFWMGSVDDALKNPVFRSAHQARFYMVFINENASGTIAINNQSYVLSDFQIAVVKPNSINQIDCKTTSNSQVICFAEAFFSLRYHENMLDQFSFLENENAAFISVSSQCFYSLKEMVGLAEKEFLSNKKDALKALRSYLNIILIEINRNYKPLKVSISQGFAKDKALKFQQLIKKHAHENALPSFYADKLHISTNYLNRISKQHFGVSAGAFIRNHIILESKRILHFTSLTVSEIAFQLGFDHVSYFSAFFKKETGETPEQFRKSK
ncbi:helix-turn-helix domain-containing protein [Paenimyroides aestuarii]|uniref:Helix-turn-helix domain-containing protein n=1 Tax=Paenimyroides aestuarii TaxID=2968490 RepID=A0ABY5NSJ0_9FLAO|nr:helix-turn-helix domain-containing protein [Paenimyroides aestuarii]UUV21532.1 helix-turn-helix domain-containing protein [Paenimyroides aestuarii]